MATRTARDIRLAGLVMRLWDGGIDLADGGRVWAGNLTALAAEAGLGRYYLSHLLSVAVGEGMAERRAGSRGCWLVSQEQRDAAAAILEAERG